MRFEIYIKDKGAREDYDEVDMVFTDAERAAHYIQARLVHMWLVRVNASNGVVIELLRDDYSVRTIRKQLDAMGHDVREL